jgi:hypothetical protein
MGGEKRIFQCDIGGREKFIIKVMRGPRHYDPEK